MIKLKELSNIRWGTGLLALFAVVMAALAPLMLTGTAQAEDGQAKAWKDITMIYTTDIKGKIEPCG